MMDFMMNSPVGDDVFGDDPTVELLEKEVAELTGKEAAMFCVTGVMGNQLCIKTLVDMAPNEFYLKEVICDLVGHVFVHESGGIVHHSRAQPKPLKTEKYLTAAHIRPHLSVGTDLVERQHTPRTVLICVENTIGGRVVPLEVIQEISELAKQHKIFLHLDGARLWNASAETGIPIKDYCKLVDSASLCLSKGLGAPIGSVIVGSSEFIHRARHYRKLFGGGWRQAGVLAACGLYAIRNHFPRLKDDHLLAATLRDGLAKIGFEMGGETNVVFVNTKPKDVTIDELREELKKNKIVIRGSGFATRVVVHQQITKEAVELFLQTAEKLVSEKAK